jgi:hypothetical protein
VAKPRRAKDRYTGKSRRRMVSAIADVLRTGEPTIFRFEAVCRHTLRSVMVLRGRSWPLSDQLAAEVVRSALQLIGAQRPPWLWGQREYTADSSATRIAVTHCLNCGTQLEDERTKFCSGRCGNHYRKVAEKTVEAIAADRVRSAAAREAYREKVSALRCEACEHEFKPSYPGQKFCSRQCSGGRSVAQKMNGKPHPWMNGKSMKTGANGANGAGHSSPAPPPSGNGSAIADARSAIITPSSNVSAPQPAPS